MQILPIKTIRFKIKDLSFICLLGYLFIGLFPPTAEAEGMNLKVQPANLQIRATPPADIAAPFTIENRGQEPIDLTIILKNFRDKGDGSSEVVYSNPQFTLDADPFLLKPQVLDNGLPIRTLTLGPQQKEELQLFIPAVSNEAVQDHYFSIIFLSQPEDIEKSTQNIEATDSFSTVQAGISLPVLLSLDGNKNRGAITNNFTAPLFVQEGPVPFSLKVKNDNEHFVTVRGAIFIKNMFGQIVGRIDVPHTSVLAQSTRSITTPGDEQVLWKEKFLLGFYTATLTLAQAPEQSLYTHTSYFFAFPVIGFVILFVMIVLGISLLLRIKKKVAQE